MKSFFARHAQKQVLSFPPRKSQQIWQRFNAPFCGKFAVIAGVTAIALSACGTDDGVDTASTDDASMSTPATFSSQSLEGMRILMGNDDSMQATDADGGNGLGLYAMRSALCQAGADVVVFAPWGFQSSKSGAISHNGEPFSVSEPDNIPGDYAGACADAPSGGAVYGVCLDDSGSCEDDSQSATPVDAITFGIQYGLPEIVGWDSSPDVVVSGVNSGPNVASQIPTSGTFAVAESAYNAGIPAIAFSASINAEFTVSPGTYDAASAFGVDLLSHLYGSDLLSNDYIVSVNYPDAPDGQQNTDIRFTEPGTATVLVGQYSATPEGAYANEGILCTPDTPFCAPETKENSDFVALLSDGAVSVSAISGERTFAPKSSEENIGSFEGLIEFLATP